MTWLDKAREAISKSSKESSIYIGCDSVRYKKGYDKNGKDRWFARYAVVIVLHKDSCHGCQVFPNIVTLPDYAQDEKQLRQRLLTEVQMSIDAFIGIEDVLDGRHLEIHLDVNPDPIHGSNIVVKEASGWVLGMGLTPKIKNDAWAASTAADYCARGGLQCH